VILGLLGQAPAAAEGTPAEAAARLATMKRTVAGYDVRSAEDPKRVYKINPEPTLRFSNPVGRTRDGAVFLWLDDDHRPAATVQISSGRDGAWFHELLSLSTGRLAAKIPGHPDWTPTHAGVEFRPVPNAPTPADTAEQRLAQMRALTRGFVVEDDFQGQSWQTLRLLSKPFARYGKAGTDVLDGALFCFVLTTDPEVLLMLEARRGGHGFEWQYAFAPMTIYPVRASWKGKKVWEREYEWGAGAAFYNGPVPVVEAPEAERGEPKSR